MSTSMIKRLKQMNKMSDREWKPFWALLTSLHIDDAMLTRLAMPVAEQVKQEARTNYRRFCIFLTVLAVAACGVAAYGLTQISLQKDDQVFALWGLIIVLSAVVLLCMKIAHGRSDASHLTSQKPMLVYFRFQTEGSMGAMLEEVNRQGRTFIPSGEEDRAETGMLKPWGAKIAVILLVAVNLVMGAALYVSGITLSMPTTDGVVLMAWQNDVDDTGTVVIPAEINGKPVTTIGKLAFEDRYEITKIVVPDTVRMIESGAFRGCENLTEIVLPDTVESIGAEAFSGCCRLVNFTVPTAVTEIRAETFKGCTNLEAVKLHPGIVRIHSYAFDGCASLKEIELPDGLTEIAAHTFRGCSSLKTVVIPASVTEVGAYAFNACKWLKNVVFLGDMLDGKIGEGAFRDCTRLAAFTVPKGVTKISAYAFCGCSGMETIELPPVLEEGKISEYCFYGSGLISITIPDGVVKISGHAFQNCGSLREVTVPSTLRSIGSSAFRSCSSLKRIVIPQDCVVDERAFKNSSTRIVRLSKTSRYSVANGEASLLQLGLNDVKDGVAVIPAEYRGCPVTTIDFQAFADHVELVKIVLPDTVTTIENSAFERCLSLREIVLPKNLVSLGERAFFGCSQLKEITLPEGVLVVPEQCFWDCTALETVVLPAGLKKIEPLAFKGCISLTSMTAPDLLMEIGYDAFKQCKQLKVKLFISSEGNLHADALIDSGVTVEVVRPQSSPEPAGDDEPAATPAPESSQDGVRSGNMFVVSRTEATLVYVDESSINQGVFIIPAEYAGRPVTRIGEGAFKNQTTLTTVRIPDSVMTIGPRAFEGCTSLFIAVLPNSLTEIGAYAFQGCSKLERLTFPVSMENGRIGEGAFSGCVILPSVVLPDGLVTLEARAFYGCAALETAVIPSTLQTIGEKAFGGCSALKRISLPDSCSVDETAFEDSPAVVKRYASETE